MRISGTVFLATLVLIGCAQEGKNSNKNNDASEIKITGTVGFPQSEGMILLEKIKGNQLFPVDTLVLDAQYNINHSIQVDDPGYYRINFYNKQFVNVILDKDDIEVRVDGNSQNGFAEVTGSPDLKLISSVQEQVSAFNSSEAVANLNRDFQAAQASQDAEAIEAIQQSYADQFAELKSNIKAHVKEQGPSIGALNVVQSLQVFDPDQDLDLYLWLADGLETHYPHSSVAKEFVNSVEGMKQLSIGSLAPEIELPNPDGEMVKLSSLRGNYVLVDFWAKWCGPCRRENPNVVKVYNKYNKDGFEVFGVSLDRNRKDWLQGIEEDKLTWTQVSDLKYWQSEAAKTYNVKGIPFAVLLDPDGKIIAKNLRGRALERKLSDIFGH